MPDFFDQKYNTFLSEKAKVNIHFLGRTIALFS